MPNNVVCWMCWQVLVQGDHAGVCLLCLMTWENCHCWTGPRLQGTPCTGAAESDWEGCSRRPELSSQTRALTSWWFSDSHNPCDNVRVERQSQGNYVGAPLILSVLYHHLCSLAFSLFLPWSLPQPVHSFITQAPSVTHAPQPRALSWESSKHSSSTFCCFFLLCIF